MVTGKYKYIADKFYSNHINSPSLWLLGTRDILVPEIVCEHVMGLWKSRGISVNSVYFQGSNHVSHLRNHHDEYKSALYQLIDDCLIPKIQPTQSTILTQSSIVL